MPVTPIGPIQGPNFGGPAALGQGLTNFADMFMRAKALKNQQKNFNFAKQISLAEHGLTEDPNTGNFAPSEAALAQKRYNANVTKNNQLLKLLQLGPQGVPTPLMKQMRDQIEGNDYTPSGNTGLVPDSNGPQSSVGGGLLGASSGLLSATNDDENASGDSVGQSDSGTDLDSSDTGGEQSRNEANDTSQASPDSQTAKGMLAESIDSDAQPTQVTPQTMDSYNGNAKGMIAENDPQMVEGDPTDANAQPTQAAASSDPLDAFAGFKSKRQIEQEKYSTAQTQKLQDKEYGALKDLRAKGGEYDKAIGTVGMAKQIIPLIKDATTNPISANAVAMYAARYSNGGQRLNQPEIQAFQGGSKALLDRLSQIAKTGSSGTLTPQNAAFMDKFIRVSSASAQKSAVDEAMTQAKSFRDVYGRSPSWVNTLIPQTGIHTDPITGERTQVHFNKNTLQYE
jgi:hypothetical protein